MTRRVVRKWIAGWMTALLSAAVCADGWGQAPGLAGIDSAGAAYTTHRESSSNADMNRNADARSIAPGETLVLGEITGPGRITHIWCTVASEDVFYSRALVVRMYWDGAAEPAVEAPLGDFFAVGHGAHADVSSAMVAVSSEGRGRNCYWPMPFRKSAKITVTNESKVQKTDSFYYYLDWQKLDAAPADAQYFHAQYRQATPAGPGDYTILETAGRGRYVGTVYSVQQMETGWFGEGDDWFYIDGEETPSLRGTGTEDYFGDAWGFRTVNQPYYGVPLWEGYFAGDRVSAYRWHVDGPIAFNKSLRVMIEHKGSIFTDQTQFLGQFIERSDWISSVAFWYADNAGGPTAPWPALETRLPPYRVLNGDALTFRATPPQMITKGNGGVNYLPMKPDASIEFDFEVETPGRYRMDAVMMYGFTGGVYQASLDGAALGQPIDFCCEGNDALWKRLDVHDLSAGKHTLRFEGRGPSPNLRSLGPKIHGLGFMRLVLLRLEDMAGYHEAMKAEQERQKAAKK